MCGLISIISKKTSGFSDKELKIFNEGLFADTFRGKDSTGVFSVTDIGNVYTMKNNISGDKFINTQDFEKFIQEGFFSSRILVGHNRSATLGNISAKNAHPFISGNTVLVHNGTLYNHKNLADTETDSEAITNALDKDTFIKVLPTLNGAFALIWYNAKEKQLYVTRNNERPLWIIQTKDVDLIGSEPKMLEWILHRNTNIDLAACYFKPYTVYIWDLNNLKDSYTKTIEFEKKKTIQSFFPTFQQTSTTVIGNTSDKIFFKSLEVHPIKFEIVNNKVIITSTNPDQPNIIFSTSVFNRTEEEIKNLENKKTIFVTPYSKIKDNIYLCTLETSTFFLKDIKGNEHILPQHNNCSKCSKYITKNDDGLIWVRVKQNRIKTIYCPSCVAANPNLNQ